MGNASFGVIINHLQFAKMAAFNHHLPILKMAAIQTLGPRWDTCDGGIQMLSRATRNV